MYRSNFKTEMHLKVTNHMAQLQVYGPFSIKKTAAATATATATTATTATTARTAYGEQGPAKLSRHKAAKPLNLDHAAKPRSHKATCRHSLTGASQRHKAAKLQKTQNVVEFECTKSAAKASRNTLACMAGHEPRLWCFSSL